MTRKRSDPSKAVMRLTLQFAGLMFVVLLLLSTTVFSIVFANAKEADERLLATAATVKNPLEAPPNTFVIVKDMDPQSPNVLMVAPGLPEGLPDLASISLVTRTGQDVRSSVTAEGRNYTVLTTLSGRYLTQVALDTHETAEELTRLLIALLWGTVLSTLVAGLLAWFMARRAVQPLISALEIQRRFIADASHELRTPLTLLSTRAQLLRRKALSEALSEARAEESPTDATAAAHGASPSGPATPLAGIDEIIADAQQLTEILEDLLLASDPREDVTPELVDLRLIAEQAVNASRSRAEADGMTLELVRGDEPCAVKGLTVPLTRLATALLSNALDHASSRVTIEVRRVKGEVVLQVRDDGPGLPSGTGMRVFERFASVRDPRPEQDRHYGLGLAIVADIATRFGGSVFLGDSEPGSGATVGARFPAATV